MYFPRGMKQNHALVLFRFQKTHKLNDAFSILSSHVGKMERFDRHMMSKLYNRYIPSKLCRFRTSKRLK